MLEDGYPIIHHLRPGLQYMDMPQEFIKRKASVFDGIHYLHIFFYLITKQYNKLADNLVNINDMFESRDKAILIMQEHTRRIQPATISEPKSCTTLLSYQELAKAFGLALTTNPIPLIKLSASFKVL